MHPTNCPSCDIAWYESSTIYEHFLDHYGDSAKARSVAANYGCTPESPKHFGCNVVGIQYRDGYDGVSEWRCKSCKSRFDRWTMKPIIKD